jgi:hypothetical protein
LEQGWVVGIAETHGSLEAVSQMARKRQWEALESHPFCRKVGINAALAVAHYLPASEKELADLQKHPKPTKQRDPLYDFYCIQVGRRLQNALDTLWKIEASTIFLGQYPYKRTLAKLEITRDRYMIYHLESYYVSVASCVDRVALLVNDVFDLGLPADLAKVHNLIRMDQLKNNKAGKALKSMYDSLMRERHLKNLITHEAEIRELGLEDFIRYSYFAQEDESTPEDKRKQLHAAAKLSLSLYLTKKRKELNDLNAKIQKQLVAIFDELLRVYERKQPPSLMNSERSFSSINGNEP